MNASLNRNALKRPCSPDFIPLATQKNSYVAMQVQN